MAKIVIIGAGPTGLSAAYHLEQQGFFDYQLFEKENTTGGLCRSVTEQGYTFDFTGHLLHIGDTYFRNFIESVVGMENFNTIHRRSYVYSQGVYTLYPYQINLHGLPHQTISECIEGFVKRSSSLRNPRSFPDWVMKNFGAGFAKYFFLPYQRKIFAYDLKQITASWTGRFVPSTSLAQIVEGATSNGAAAMQSNTTQAIGYNSTFFYPQHGGISFWVDKLAHRLQNPIRTNFCVDTVDLVNKVITFTNGHQEPYEQLITTMPLDRFLQNTHEPSSLNIKAQRKNLLCNKVVNFNLGIRRENLSDKHWIYYPEKQYPFYRIGFSHNFAASMAPKNCSSLYGEFSYVHETPQTVKARLKKSLQVTKQLLGITDTEVAVEKIMHIDHAYVIYDFWREKNLPHLHERLHDHQVYSVGRYGEWKYSSMQEAILDGKAVVEKILGTSHAVL